MHMVWVWIVLVIVGIVLVALLGYTIYKMIVTTMLIKNFANGFENTEVVELNKEYLSKIKERDIDEIVYHDLELDKVYQIINHTYTNVGKEYMYAQFFASDDDSEQFESLMEHWKNNKTLKETLFTLHQLSKQYSESLDLFAQTKNITRNSALAIFGSFFVLLVILSAAMFIGVEILSFAILWVVFQGIIYTLYSKKLDHLMSQTAGYCALIFALDRLCSLGIYRDEDTCKMKPMLRKAKKYTLLFRICNKIEKIDIFYLMELVKAIFFIPYCQCLLLKKHQEELSKDILSIYKYIGMVDVSLSIYGVRLNYDTCIPRRVDKPILRFENGYHPSLKNGVKNSFSSASSCIITGTNASGKSTFLKMVGINEVMARAFHTCFASSFDYYPFQLCSSIHMKDDLDSGDSYYVKEIKVMKHILDLSKEKTCLIFIDEILRGTNEKERVAISRAVLQQLFTSKALVLVTTHDLHLVESFLDVQQYCFHDDVKKDVLYCDYTIKPGICKVGNAIRLLEVYGYDKEILSKLKES